MLVFLLTVIRILPLSFMIILGTKLRGSENLIYVKGTGLPKINF